MIKVTKLGHVGFKTPDVARLLAYYTEVLGLTLVERGADGTAYLGSGVDHHGVVLYPASESHVDHIAFQIRQDLSLKEVAAMLSQAGVKAELQSDPQPGLSEILQLADPDGYTLQLYNAIELKPYSFGQVGIIPEKLGHIALKVTNVKRTVEFFQKILGFRISDSIGGFFYFLRCNPDHHSINFLERPQTRMHHVAYQLKDWAHVQQACDFLFKHNIPLVWGPGRHGAGHNIYTYHRDPDNNIIELFTELDLMLDEDLGYFEPRPWHEDFPQRPKEWGLSPTGPNHWGIMPPEGFMD